MIKIDTRKSTRIVNALNKYTLMHLLYYSRYQIQSSFVQLKVLRLFLANLG